MNLLAVRVFPVLLLLASFYVSATVFVDTYVDDYVDDVNGDGSIVGYQAHSSAFTDNPNATIVIEDAITFNLSSSPGGGVHCHNCTQTWPGYVNSMTAAHLVDDESSRYGHHEMTESALVALLDGHAFYTTHSGWPRTQTYECVLPAGVVGVGTGDQAMWFCHPGKHRNATCNATLPTGSTVDFGDVPPNSRRQATVTLHIQCSAGGSVQILPEGLAGNQLATTSGPASDTVFNLDINGQPAHADPVTVMVPTSAGLDVPLTVTVNTGSQTGGSSGNIIIRVQPL
jgi:hypothetical protein